MKIIKLITIFLFFYSLSFAQTLTPTENKALLFMLVVDNSENPIQEKIVVKSIKTNKLYTVFSNNKGLAEVLLPKSDTYIINLENEPNYDKIVIPNKEFYSLNYKIFYEKNRNADNKTALIRFVLKNSDKVAISEKVTLISSRTKEKYSFTTNAKGYGEIKVPNKMSYTVNYKNAPNYHLIIIPDVDNYELDFDATYNGSYPGSVYPSRNKALFTFTFINLDGFPVANEKFYLKSEKNSKEYSITTDVKGKAFIHVPIGDTYQVSSEYNKNLGTRKVGAKLDLYQVDVTLKFISSIEFRKREKEREFKLKERDAEWLKYKKEYEAYIKVYEKYKEDCKEIVKKEGGTEASPYTSSGFMNFETLRDTVFTAVFNRNKHWKNKLIIIDVTGSMQPYTDQVRWWYKLNYAENDLVQFVLFNDGDNRPDNTKNIGSTGGIHYCKSCDIQTFSNSLAHSRRMGNGGDGPENDIEATIEATKNCENYTDIILVADNYSSVKDIELLYKIKKPIKIILCGANSGYINTDYLEIAYQTKGSIHTIEEDIVNIGNTIDGAKIKIGSNHYILSQGKFLHYKDYK